MLAPLYNEIGKNYDSTRKADSTIARKIGTLLNVPAESKVLDVACGTGNYTSALAQSGLSMVGIDQSLEMLSKARRKSPGLTWVEGNAEKMPLADATFAGAVCTFAIYLFRDAGPVVSEIHRVLSSGRLVIFTFTPEQVRGYWLNEYFPISMQRVANKMLSFESLSAKLRDAGFRDISSVTYRVTPDVQDNFLYSGKHRPHVYLEPTFRAGISAFVTLGEPAEIERGCLRLADDIATGRIDQVMARYSGAAGDCLFIVAQK